MKSYLGFGTRCKLCHMAMLVLGFLFWFIIESLWDTIIIGIPTFIVFVYRFIVYSVRFKMYVTTFRVFDVGH
jgi:hypothetical protein